MVTQRHLGKVKATSYNALISPIAIHGSETLSLTQLDTKMLNLLENNCLRAILNIRLQDMSLSMKYEKVQNKKKKDI